MGEVNGPHQQPGVADGLVAEDERLGRSRPGGDLARGDAPHRAAPHSPAENAGAEAYLRLQDKKSRARRRGSSLGRKRPGRAETSATSHGHVYTVRRTKPQAGSCYLVARIRAIQKILSRINMLRLVCMKPNLLRCTKSGRLGTSAASDADVSPHHKV